MSPHSTVFYQCTYSLAIAVLLLRATSTPAPDSSSSLILANEVATTGTLGAIASNTTVGVPSALDRSRSISLPLMYF